MTFGELLDSWLDLVGDRLSPTTLDHYRGYAARYLKPALGTRPIRRITSRDLDRLYLAMSRDRGLAPRTVRQDHAVVRGAFGQAVKWSWLATNPALTASPPPVRKHDISPPSPAAVGQLVAAAEQASPELAVFLRLAAATGARRGELCALRWTDLDLDEAVIVISRNLIDPAGGGWIEKDTKTHQARCLSLDARTVAILARHRAWSVERSMACGVGQASDAFVFSDHPAATEPWLPNTVTHRFMDLCRREGVTGVRLHDLRHMHATQLLGANLDVRTVAGRLGHANAATTLGVYAHFLQARDQDAADVIGALLDGPDSNVAPAQRRPRRTARKVGDS